MENGTTGGIAREGSRIMQGELNVYMHGAVPPEQENAFFGAGEKTRFFAPTDESYI